jgi:hypothetical protein
MFHDHTLLLLLFVVVLSIPSPSFFMQVFKLKCTNFKVNQNNKQLVRFYFYFSINVRYVEFLFFGIFFFIFLVFYFWKP